MTNKFLVQQISQCFINSKYAVEESKKPFYLGVVELAYLSSNYIQKGLLYIKPPTMDDQEEPIVSLLEKLKESLSLTLVHFYPLSGRLATIKQENPQSYVVFLDCNNSPGAKFIHASVNMELSDVITPIDVPIIVDSFFDLDRAINHDGHTMPLLSIQVTELVDGIFIGCSMNHSVADGSSFWHFFETWSEIFKADGKEIIISRPPVHKRWFPSSCSQIINLPYSHPDEFISRYESPEFRDRVFHFSSSSIVRLKERAKLESNTDKISSLQALIALVWRCVTRARCFPPEQVTNCTTVINTRTRFDPPLSVDYFGCSVQIPRAVCTVGELLHNSLGWAALLVHQSIHSYNNETLCEFIEEWIKSPWIPVVSQLYDSASISFGSSPRFDMYANEFGLGKAIAIRSGHGNKYDGNMSLYPGCEGGGSIDLEVCLAPNSMSALESDTEFMDSFSSSN